MSTLFTNTPMCLLLRWWDPQLMRFVHDEAARHETALLVGSLALAAQPGHAGMPLGHVVSYQVRWRS